MWSEPNQIAEELAYQARGANHRALTLALTLAGRSDFTRGMVAALRIESAHLMREALNEAWDYYPSGIRTRR